MPVRAAAAVALLCCSCAHEPATALPLVGETATVTAPSTRSRPVTRSFASKTIGADPYPVRRAPDDATTSPAPPAHVSPRANPWSPTPVYGLMNPSPPAPATPVYGDLNPSPPGR